MSTQSDIQRLEAEILGIESTIRECTRSTKRAAATSIATAAALLGLVACFILINYSRVCAELSQEKLLNSLTRELGEVAPLAMSEIQRLGQDLLPLYAQEFKSQLETRWPEIAARVEREVEEIGSRALTDANAALRGSEERIEAALLKTIFDCYPEVHDPVQREEIERQLKTTCDQTLALTLDSFDRTFSKDLDRLQQTVLQFDVSDGHDDHVDLQKRFLRLWLQLLDQEVLEI
jgi:hypothetical protein